MLHRLAYLSEARLSADTEAAELADIVGTGRRKNAQLGITGALLLREGMFAQILEGDLTPLEAIFERIQADPRHGEVRILYFRPVAERLFAGWDLACAGTPPDLASPLGRDLIAELETLFERRAEWAAGA